MFSLCYSVAYRKGLGCTDALLTLSHQLQKSLDIGMKSYIVQFYFIAALDRVSHSGLTWSGFEAAKTAP